MSDGLSWQKLSQSEEKVGFRWITHKRFLFPDGVERDFTTFGRRTKNCMIFALTTDNKLIIIRQFRAGPERLLYDIPGGMVDDNEDPSIAARRELLEETGYTCDEELEFIGVLYRDAYKNESDYYFLARNCHRVGDQKLDPAEFIEVSLMDIEQAINLAKQGEMTETQGFLLAYDKLKEIESEGNDDKVKY